MVRQGSALTFEVTCLPRAGWKATMSETQQASPDTVAGQVDRGVRPLAHKLASQLQNAAYNHGYEDAHPANATTRQDKAAAKACEVLAALYAECDRMAASEAKTNSYIVDNARLAARVQELSYGLERVMAQRDDEGDRLDWLMVKLKGSVTRELLGVMSHTGDPAEFRRRIDEVRGTPARCVREVSPGRACGLMPPCPDCGRACHDVPEGS